MTYDPQDPSLYVKDVQSIEETRLKPQSATSSQRIPRQDIDVGTILRFVAPIDHLRTPAFHAGKLVPLFQPAQRIQADLGAGLELDGENRSALTHQQIDFMPGSVAQKAQVGWQLQIDIASVTP
jgi:hypothetical protein